MRPDQASVDQLDDECSHRVPPTLRLPSAPMRSQRVKLSDIQALSFYQDRYTTSRRVDALPQQICDGSLCNEHAPDVIQCVNMGGEGSDIDWRCEASLPVEVRLGRCDVSCEGWTAPSDPWVLKGSCSLNYRLVPSSMYASNPAKIPSEPSGSEGKTLGDTLFYIAFWAVFLIIVISFLRSVFFPPGHRHDGGHDHPPRGPPPFFDGFDGPDDGYDHRPGFNGGDGGPQDPPPPYSPRSKPAQQPGQAAGGAGFWTGLVTGGLGALALNYNNSQRQQPRARRGRRFDEDTFGYVDRGEGSSTGATRTSTGFGGTANR